jgi:hypothetical protein
MQAKTTIQISTKNRDELKAIGKFGENYDDVIEKLINEYKNQEHKTRIDRIATEAKQHFRDHRDEYVSIDDL